MHMNTQKAKVTRRLLRSIPNDSHLLALIRRFTKMGVLWLRAYLQCLLVWAYDGYRLGVYDRYGCRSTVGTETGVHTGVQLKLYCDTYRSTYHYPEISNCACCAL